jgi:hypothetical protein
LTTSDSRTCPAVPHELEVLHAEQLPTCPIPVLRCPQSLHPCVSDVALLFPGVGSHIRTSPKGDDPPSRQGHPPAQRPKSSLDATAIDPTSQQAEPNRRLPAGGRAFSRRRQPARRATRRENFARRRFAGAHTPLPPHTRARARARVRVKERAGEEGEASSAVRGPSTASAEAHSRFPCARTRLGARGQKDNGRKTLIEKRQTAGP